MIELLRQQPLILLFVVVALGYPLGLIRIGGSSLGVAAVLFVGLAFGGLDPQLKLPEVLYQLGLVIFVYTVGLSSGPGFVRALRQGGLRDNALVAGVLLATWALAAGMARWLNIPAAQAAGLFAGSTTNTPALAGVLDYLKLRGADEALLAQPVVGYSIAYPVGVVGMIAALGLARRYWRPDYPAEGRALRDLGASAELLVTRTLRVTRPEVAGISVSDLMARGGWRAIFARLRHGQTDNLVHSATRLALGDLVSVVGTAEEIERIGAALGELVGEQLDLDRSSYDFRRVFVSNPALFGRRISGIDLQTRFGALVTRVRRGDIEMLARGSTVLEPGDRVRVVAPRGQMREVSELFGDSYRALSEIDILTFSLGLVLGLLLGQVPLPVPGGTLRLGVAAGPLIVALTLGAIGRTGPLTWTLPYSANLTLRQFGVVIFLASIGTRAGYAFVATLLSPGGAVLLLLGAALTATAALGTLWIGYRVLNIPMSLLGGMLAGLQTNPAVLSYATLQTDNDLPNIGYATVYPVAMIIKIVLAQLLVQLLTR